MDFTAYLFHHARANPAKPAIVLADRVVTYGMMASGIRSVAERVRTLGLEPGALVAVAIDSPIRHLIVAAALYRLGHPILSAARTRDLPSSGLPIALILEGAAESMIPGLRQVLVGDDWFTAPPADTAVPAAGSRFSGGDAVCRIDLSSGSTGLPKAFAVSVDTLNRWIVEFFTLVGGGTWERMLCLIPLSSAWGFSLAIHALYAGRTLCFAGSARETLDMVALYGVDCIAGTFQHVRELVEAQRAQPVPVPSLRVIYTGGSMPSRTLMAEAQALLCPRLDVAYASTEAGVTAIGSAERLMAVEGAVGFVVPWAELQIVDEAGHVVPTGTDGAIRIRAAHLSRPVDRDGGAAHAGVDFREGWFYPGDRGHFLADGMLVVTGRTAQLLAADGRRIAPEAVEEIVRRHPAVADAAAIGMERNGHEEIWLAVTARTALPEADLIASCRAHGIAVARVVPVAAIPRSDMGKIDRIRLKREILD